MSMRINEAGSYAPAQARIAPQVQPPAPQNENNHSIIGRALEKLYNQVAVTGKIAESLGAPLIPLNEASAPTPAAPTLTDKLYALHQLLNRLEDNTRAIAETLG